MAGKHERIAQTRRGVPIVLALALLALVSPVRSSSSTALAGATGRDASVSQLGQHTVAVAANTIHVAEVRRPMRGRGGAALAAVAAALLITAWALVALRRRDGRVALEALGALRMRGPPAV